MDSLADVRRLVIVHSPDSTRAKHYHYVRKDLAKVADAHQWPMREIALDGVPYYRAVKNVQSQLQAGDLVVAAGGDGVAQVSFNAIYNCDQAMLFATLPLGNGNDISRAFNGKHHSVAAVLAQPATDFYPLNVVADGRIVLTIASYVTFGATTVLVDYLNNQSSRRLRRVLKNLSPMASLPVGKLSDISRAINQLDFPDFLRGEQLLTDDSIGFFLIPAAHNVLRLPKDVTLASSEFFFHHAITKDKNLVNKILMAGAWTLRFPGEMTELEELKFIDNTDADNDAAAQRLNASMDIVANVSGDNVNLGPIRTLSAIRSLRSVKVLFNK